MDQIQHYLDLEVQDLIQKAEVEGSPVPGQSVIYNKTLFQNQTKQNRTITIMKFINESAVSYNYSNKVLRC